jgi:hypothetical protein
LAVAAAVTAAVCGADSSAGGNDVATVRQRLLTTLWWNGNATATAHAAWDLAATLLPNKTWPDINYDDPGDRSVWLTFSHITRVVTMCAAVSNPASPAFNASGIIGPIRNALAFWLEMDFQNDNWWFNMIGVPQQVSGAFLMLQVTPGAVSGGFPSPWDVTRGYTIMYRAQWWNASLGYIVDGANLAWMMQVQLVRGVLPAAVNMTALNQGFARLWQEAKVVNRTTDFALAEGVQADWSYAFHGPQLQIASYGQAGCDPGGGGERGVCCHLPTTPHPPLPVVAGLQRGDAAVERRRQWHTVGHHHPCTRSQRPAVRLLGARLQLDGGGQQL